MKKIKYLYVGIIALICSACGHSATTSNMELLTYTFPKTIKLEGQGEVKLQNPDFGMTYSMTLTDQGLVCITVMSPHIVNIYDIETGQKKNSYVRLGRGRGEIIQLGRAYVDGENGYAYLIDPNSSIMHKYTLNGDSTKRSDFTVQKIPNGLNNFFTIRHIADSTFLAINSSNQGGMYKLFKGDSVVAHFSEPLLFADEQRTPNIAFAYQGFFASNADNTKFIYAANACDAFELTEFKDEELISLKRYKSYRPLYGEDQGFHGAGMTVKEGNREGFRDVTTSSEYIYLLYCGRERDFKKFSETYSNEVYVLDWDGELVCKVELDHDASKICVDESNEYLYSGINTEDGYVVTKYSLSQMH